MLEEPFRMPRKRTNQKMKFGQTTEKIREEVWANPKNIFGQKVLKGIEDRKLSFAYILQHTGLHLDRLYGLILGKDEPYSTDEADIWRLADILEFSRPQLWAEYLSSRKWFHSPTYRGKPVVLKLPVEQLTGELAALGAIWEGLVHSKAYREGSPEEKGTLAVQLGELVELFVQVPAENRQHVLNVAATFAPKNVPEEIEPRSLRKKKS